MPEWNPVSATLNALADDPNVDPLFRRAARCGFDPVEAYYDRFDDAGPEAADRAEDAHTAHLQRSW